MDLQPLRVLLAATTCAALAACASLHPPDPIEVQLRDTAPAMATGSAAPWPAIAWWRSYGDATLDTLIESAIGQAPGVASADARILAAQQDVRVAGAAQGLRVDANAQFVVQRLSDNALLPLDFLGFNWYNQTDLGVTVRYQFDWWGKQRAAMESVLDLSLARASERQAAGLGLAAAISSAYFNWQSCANRMAVQQQALALLERQLQLAGRRAAAQLDTVDSTLVLQQQLAAQREVLAVLRIQQQLQVIAIAALLGTDVASLPVFTVHPLPVASGALPDDVGTNLLARRPDIAASRWRVESALRDTDAARASFYPDVSLRALIGLSSIDLARLFSPYSGVPALGMALDLPVFDGGMRRARHGAAEASLNVAIAAYNETVVNAAREAGAAAAAIEQAAAVRVQRERQVEAATALVAVASARVSRQLTHIGPQLEANLRELEARDALLRASLDAVLADVQLKQALGGGPAETETHK